MGRVLIATNVTEKDKTLNEIIDWCADLANELRDATDGDFYANVNANLIKEGSHIDIGHTSLPSPARLFWQHAHRST